MENTLYLHFSNEKWVSDHEFSVFLFEFVSRDDTKNIMRAEFTCKIHILCRILDCNSRSDDVFGFLGGREDHFLIEMRIWTRDCDRQFQNVSWTWFGWLFTDSGMPWNLKKHGIHATVVQNKGSTKQHRK